MFGGPIKSLLKASRYTPICFCAGGFHHSPLCAEFLHCGGRTDRSRNRDHGEALIIISSELKHAVASKKLDFGL